MALSQYHRDLLLLEFQQEKGWLWEVAADLHWMHDLVVLPFLWDYLTPQDIPWQQIWDCLKEYRPWQQLVARTLIANTPFKSELPEM